MSTRRDVVIVGAGPAGLSAAIAARRAGLDYEVLEKGLLVNSIYNFPASMTFFTTPELLEIGGLPFVTPYEKPTRAEALRYYRRVVDDFDLQVSLGEDVRAILREAGASGPAFRLETRNAVGTRVRHTRCVIVATGYYDHPNRLGIPGEDLPHVTHYYGDPHVHYRRRVVIVGGKNSAAIAALEAFRAGAAAVTLVHRGERLSDSIKYWIRPDIENRIKEGSVRAHMRTRVVEIGREQVVLDGPAGRSEVAADAVLLLTGYHPDVELLRGAGVKVNEATLEPAHDAETLETNVPGLFLAGAVASGLQTNRIFIENGRFHGEAAVHALMQRLGRGTPAT
jgi:thioredoxin reductase (NADPH)